MIIPAHLSAKRLTTNAKRGFTLIELLIVIAILGILAAAVLVAVNPAKRQNQAKDANIKADIASIATALQAYYTSPGAGTYPVDTATLVTNQDLKQLPAHPNGSAYTYVKTPGACLGTAASPCTDVALSGSLYDPVTAGNLWCFRSSAGKASEVAAIACTAP
mgnify:CR=1 FL=1